MVDLDLHAAGADMRIGKHLGEIVDRPAGHAGFRQFVQPIGHRLLQEQPGEDRHDLLAVHDAVVVLDEFRIGGELGQPELATNPKFIKNNDRVVHGKEIMAIFAGLFLKQPVAYWLDELAKAGVPCGPINDFAQVFADPHVRSRGMEVKVDHPFEPALSLIRNAITFSGTTVTEYRAPPLLGADTREVLGTELGYDDAKLAALKQQGII